MRRAIFALVLATASGVAAAQSALQPTPYRSIAEPAVLYDGPSTRAKRIAVASRGLPVEIISSDGTWTKVRDPSGELSWVERKLLSERRTVVVSVQIADIRQRAEAEAPVALQAAQGVVLEFGDQTGVTPGWLRVRHRDGAIGFVRINQVWGV